MGGEDYIDTSNAFLLSSNIIELIDLTDYTRNVGDVIACNRKTNSSKNSILTTCLHTASKHGYRDGCG